MPMQLLRENAVQWMYLILNGLALAMFAAGAALTLWRLRREKQGAREEELERLDRASGTLRQLLGGSVFGLVTAAERQFGPGTGEIKKSAVLAELIKLVPEQWRAQFDLETCGALIENGLAAAKEIWAKTGNKA